MRERETKQRVGRSVRVEKGDKSCGYRGLVFLCFECVFEKEERSCEWVCGWVSVPLGNVNGAFRPVGVRAAAGRFRVVSDDGRVGLCVWRRLALVRTRVGARGGGGGRLAEV